MDTTWGDVANFECIATALVSAHLGGVGAIANVVGTAVVQTGPNRPAAGHSAFDRLHVFACQFLHNND